MSALTVIVLAAGQGTRMKSQLPKVLHRIAGRPLLYYPIHAAFAAGAERAVVVTSGRSEIEAELHQHFDAERLSFALQEVPRGTGDAARIGLAGVTTERVLIVCGDTPLLSAADLRGVAQLDSDFAFVSCELDEPSGYGRVLRDASQRVSEIREDKDLRNPAERSVREVNAGVYAARTEQLRTALARLLPDNTQGEYYLTDVVRLMGGERCRTVSGHPHTLLGVNDRIQLHQAERILFARIAERHAKNGVTWRGEVWIDDGVEIGQDVVLEPGVRLRGKTKIGRGTVIDVGCVLDDVVIGDEVIVRPYSVMRQSRVENQAEIGPFSHLRPDSWIEERAHIGNFVETKKTRVRKGAKANHLSYLGDGDVGEKSNIGAGTIFCNYDGFQKHKTVIGEGVFIGSDSQIVAPVTIEKGAYVATGTTITENVPADALAIGRVRQQNKLGYGESLRQRLKAQRDAKKT